MVSELKLVDVRLTRMRDGPASFETGESARIADLSVTVHNESETDTLYVSTVLGKSAYDGDNNRLRVELHEPSEEFRPVSAITPPSQRAIRPGERLTFTLTIPLTADVPSGLEIRRIDETALRELTVDVTYSPALQKTPSEELVLSCVTKSVRISAKKENTPDLKCIK